MESINPMDGGRLCMPMVISMKARGVKVVRFMERVVVAKTAVIIVVVEIEQEKRIGHSLEMMAVEAMNEVQAGE
jgi:hypothetical protein